MKGPRYVDQAFSRGVEEGERSKRPALSASDAAKLALWPELVHSIVKIRAHTGYLPNPKPELLAGLLASIERIADDVLAKARELK